MRYERHAVEMGQRNVVMAFLCLLVLPACDTLLETQDNPEVVEAGGQLTLQETLVGAKAALRSSADEKISFEGLVGNEFTSAAPGEETRKMDARDVSPSQMSGDNGDGRGQGLGGNWYIPLQRLVAVSNLGKERIVAGEFAELPEGGTDSEEFALLAFLEGAGKLWLADMQCTMAFLGTGPELTPAEAYELAEANFTQAIEAAGVADDVRQAARVFRARARLILGDDAGALADANQVDPDFEYLVQYTTATVEQMNRIYIHTFEVSDWSVAPEYRGLTIDDTGIPDPRVDVDGPIPGGGFESTTALFVPRKYPSPATPVRIASGDEARYIVAEVEGGQTAVDIINEVRARHGIMEEFSPSGDDPTEIRDKLIDERLRTLFLEGVHMGDLRRYIEKYGLNLYTTGTTPQGLPYTDQTCLPLPAIERDNNPDI